MGDDARKRFLTDRAMQIICTAADQNFDTVADLIEEVGVAYGHDGVFGVCCALTETVRRLAFPQVSRGDGSLTDGMIAVQAGRDPADCGEAAVLWSSRFLAAYINGDGAATTSLFYGGLDDRDQTLLNVFALAKMTGDVVREKEQALRGGQ